MHLMSRQGRITVKGSHTPFWIEVIEASGILVNPITFSSE
jgi:hypothetical protein